MAWHLRTEYKRHNGMKRYERKQARKHKRSWFKREAIKDQQSSN